MSRCHLESSEVLANGSNPLEECSLVLHGFGVNVSDVSDVHVTIVTFGSSVQSAKDDSEFVIAAIACS